MPDRDNRYIKCNVTADFDGKPLLTLLKTGLALSSTLIKRIKSGGRITVNGADVTVRYTVKTGDSLCITLPVAQSGTIEPCEQPLDILYEDDVILAVNKPAGIPVHPSPGNRTSTLANSVMYRYRGEPFVFRAVTRLDKYTSGIVLIAKTPDSAAALCTQLKEGKIKKEYLAVTAVPPEPPCGVIDAPIARVEGSVLLREVSPNGRGAVTRYETLESTPEGTLVAAFPLTGRTHQIRVHLAAIGCPLKDDFLYGTEQSGKHFLLHCRKITFNHPRSGKNVTITCFPSGDEWKSFSL